MITIPKPALVVLALLNLLTTQTAGAAVCMKKSGALAVRPTCGARETAVTPTMLGIATMDGTAGAKGDRGSKGEKGDSGAAGVPGPKGNPALAGGIFSYNIQEAYIGDVAGDGRAIASLVLPPGRFLVMARFDAVNLGTPTFVRCFLDLGNYRAQMATTFIGDVNGVSVGAVETLSFLLPIDTGAGLTVSVRCRPEAPTGGREETYIESGVLAAMPSDAWVLQ